MKNSCFWTVVLEKTLQSPLDCKEIQPLCPKGNQSWIFIGRTDAEAAIPQPPDVKHLLFGKDPEAGKDWRGRKKGWQKTRWLDGIPDLIDMCLNKFWELVMGREAWPAAGHEFAKSQAWLSDWTEQKPQTSRWSFLFESSFSYTRHHMNICKVTVTDLSNQWSDEH